MQYDATRRDALRQLERLLGKELSCNIMQYDATRRDALRQVERLLGKELVGAPAVGVEQLAPRSAVPDGELQDMAVQRLDSREQKRREFYNKKR